jgi:phthalate 3,4-dioxygenase alpha subunit
MIPAMAESWSAEQRALVADSGFMVSAATLFPNLSLVHNWPQIDESGTVAPFISLRQWQPVSATETEVLSWFAVDAAAPEEFKRGSYKAYLMCFGSSGMFEQDDVENWVSITDMAAGSMARRLNLNSRMGLNSAGQPIKPPMAAFAGPGVAYQGFGEFNQRHWLRQWTDHLEREPAVQAAVNLGGAR